MNTWCSVRGVRLKRTHSVWFHVCDMSSTGTSMETRNALMVARGWGRKMENRAVIAERCRVSSGGDENVL